VIVVKNHDVARGLFHRLKKYTSGHFEALIWDNVGLRKKWKTRKFSGYISDYDVSDLDNDGTDELVFAVIAKSDGPISEAKSYIARRGFRPRAVRNNLYCNPTNGSRSAKIHPGQPQRTDSHGSDNLRCLSRGELKILGALPKPEKDLLRPAAA
jgi:hypothetical protein